MIILLPWLPGVELHIDWRWVVRSGGRLTRSCVAVLFCCALQVLAVSSANALSLEQYIGLALSREAGYLAALAAAAAERFDGWRDVADYGPRLHLSGSYQQSRDALGHKEQGLASSDQAVSFQEAAFTMTAEQPIIDLEKAGRFGRGLITMERAALQRKKAVEELVLNACERYYTALSRREHSQLAAAESAALQMLLRSTEKRLDLGFGTITDRHNAEARYRLSQAQEISTRTELDNALRALEELVNEPLDATQLEDGSDIVADELGQSLEVWHSLALRHNTDLQISRLRLALAEADRSIARSRFAPSLVLFAAHREYHPNGGVDGWNEERRETDIGVRLDVNLLAGGQDAAGVLAATSRMRSAREQIVAAERALTRSLHSLWESIAGTAELVRTYRRAVDANRLALEATEASYQEGAKVLLDVLNAQQDYYRSRKAYHTARYDYLLLREKFKLVVGTYE